jgi:hypothetical protein
VADRDNGPFLPARHRPQEAPNSDSGDCNPSGASHRRLCRRTGSADRGWSCSAATIGSRCQHRALSTPWAVHWASLARGAFRSGRTLLRDRLTELLCSSKLAPLSKRGREQNVRARLWSAGLGIAVWVASCQVTSLVHERHLPRHHQARTLLLEATPCPETPSALCRPVDLQAASVTSRHTAIKCMITLRDYIALLPNLALWEIE